MSLYQFYYLVLSQKYIVTLFKNSGYGVKLPSNRCESKVVL